MATKGVTTGKNHYENFPLVEDSQSDKASNNNEKATKDLFNILIIKKFKKITIFSLIVQYYQAS